MDLLLRAGRGGVGKGGDRRVGEGKGGDGREGNGLAPLSEIVNTPLFGHTEPIMEQHLLGTG